MLTSWVIIPTKVKTKVVAVSGTSSVYFPSISVIVPVVVPLTLIETPGIASPFSVVTVPVIFLGAGVAALTESCNTVSSEKRNVRLRILDDCSDKKARSLLSNRFRIFFILL